MSPWTRLALDHVVIRVEDMERMLGFYRDVLGCAVSHRQDALGLVHLSAGSALIDLVWVGGKLGRGGAAPDRERPNLDHLCIAVSPWNEAALRAHLAAHGVAVEPAAMRYGAGGQALSVYLRDPEGNGVEIRDAGAARQPGNA